MEYSWQEDSPKHLARNLERITESSTKTLSGPERRQLLDAAAVLWRLAAPSPEVHKAEMTQSRTRQPFEGNRFAV